MKVGQLIDVTVTEVHSGYASVDFQGKAATLQLTEITWKTGSLCLFDYVQIGKKIRVKVIAILGEAFSVSLKQACPDGNPWDKSPQVGDQFIASISLVIDYAYWLEITYFCRALLPLEHTSETYEAGDKLHVEVTSVDRAREHVMLKLVDKQ